MMECVRRVQFCSGHRVLWHENKCANPHGHNYVAYIHARAIKLDPIGRVIDFSVLKERVGSWIDRNWDHGFIYYSEDNGMAKVFHEPQALIENWKNYCLPVNPTAENMAKYLVEEVAPIEMKGTGIEVYKVTLWETENCYAVYSK